MKEFENCLQLRDTRLCDISRAQVNLRANETCLSAMIFSNTSYPCPKRLVNATHEIWIATSGSEWFYVVPKPTKLTTTIGENSTETMLTHSGTIKQNPRTKAFTDQVTLTCANEEEVEVEMHALEGLTFQHWDGYRDTESIPTLPEPSVFTLVNKKHLFDIGIDTRNLDDQRTILKNIVYAPLERPWLTLPIVLLIGVIFLALTKKTNCRVSCCKTYEPGKAKPAEREGELDMVDWCNQTQSEPSIAIIADYGRAHVKNVDEHMRCSRQQSAHGLNIYEKRRQYGSRVTLA